jgi:hypothetical protein
MKLADVIQEVQVFPEQRLATSSVAKPAGWKRQKSEARWSKLTGFVLSLESDHRCGPVKAGVAKAREAAGGPTEEEEGDGEAAADSQAKDGRAAEKDRLIVPPQIVRATA